MLPSRNDFLALATVIIIFLYTKEIISFEYTILNMFLFLILKENK